MAIGQRPQQWLAGDKSITRPNRYIELVLIGPIDASERAREQPTVAEAISGFTLLVQRDLIIAELIVAEPRFDANVSIVPIADRPIWTYVKVPSAMYSRSSRFFHCRIRPRASASS